MNTNNLLWVLGHKIRLLDTDDSYGMIEVTSPPQVPGPPPHFHIGIPMQESHAGITCRNHRHRRNLWWIKLFKMC
jgi:hypothetical protein